LVHYAYTLRPLELVLEIVQQVLHRKGSVLFLHPLCYNLFSFLIRKRLFILYLFQLPDGRTLRHLVVCLASSIAFLFFFFFISSFLLCFGFFFLRFLFLCLCLALCIFKLWVRFLSFLWRLFCLVFPACACLSDIFSCCLLSRCRLLLFGVGFVLVSRSFSRFLAHKLFLFEL
jgi:hypothetical protein